MKIVRPYAKLLWHSAQRPMSNIEWAARISHRAEDRQTDDSWHRFLQSVVIDHGDWSVVEHVTATVDAVVDRGITHEWVRHRLFSYTQESTRFVNYEKKMPPSFIYPKPEVECSYCLTPDPNWNGMSLRRDSNNFGGITWAHETSGAICDRAICSYHQDWLESINRAENSYKALIDDKWRPQEARSVFPNALASRIVITGNLRNWRHFFIMRTTQEAHPQMRQVTIPLLAEFQRTFPILFDDLAPNMKQSESMRRPR